MVYASDYYSRAQGFIKIFGIHYEFIELIEKEKITFTVGATPFLQDTVQLEGIENRNINSLRVFLQLWVRRFHERW